MNTCSVATVIEELNFEFNLNLSSCMWLEAAMLHGVAIVIIQRGAGTWGRLSC